MDKCGGPKYYVTCLLHTPIASITMSDTNFKIGSEDVEALVTVCKRHLST